QKDLSRMPHFRYVQQRTLPRLLGRALAASTLSHPPRVCVPMNQQLPSHVVEDPAPHLSLPQAETLGQDQPALPIVTPAPKPAPRASFLQRRLHSLDAYRGLIMVTLAFSGFGLAQTARLHLRADPDSDVWQNVFHNFEHVEWTGCGYWDLIQPSFMFMV